MIQQARALVGQHPDGHEDDTPGVAVAPVTLAGAIMPGAARLIVIASLHAAEFGVGMTLMVRSLVSPSNEIAGWIVPAGGSRGISEIASGKAAPFVGGPLG